MAAIVPLEFVLNHKMNLLHSDIRLKLRRASIAKEGISMRRTVIALLLLMSGAAAAVAQHAKQDGATQVPQRGHCAVGVVSNLGEKFRVEEYSLLLGNSVSEVPVESWHLDDLVVDKIRGALGKQAVVQRIRYQKEAVVMRTVFWWRVADGAATLRRLAAGTRCARYVVVTEGRVTVADGVEDKGIAISRAFIASAQSGPVFGSGQMHAVIQVTVYDGETFKLLGRRVDESSRGSIQIFRTAHPKRLVDDSFWPVPPSSAERNTKLREVTRELLTECLDKTLPRLPLR